MLEQTQGIINFLERSMGVYLKQVAPTLAQEITKCFNALADHAVDIADKYETLNERFMRRKLKEEKEMVAKEIKETIKEDTQKAKEDIQKAKKPVKEKTLKVCQNIIVRLTTENKVLKEKISELQEAMHEMQKSVNHYKLELDKRYIEVREKDSEFRAYKLKAEASYAEVELEIKDLAINSKVDTLKNCFKDFLDDLVTLRNWWMRAPFDFVW